MIEFVMKILALEFKDSKAFILTYFQPKCDSFSEKDS